MRKVTTHATAANGPMSGPETTAVRIARGREVGASELEVRAVRFRRLRVLRNAVVRRLWPPRGRGAGGSSPEDTRW